MLIIVHMDLLYYKCTILFILIPNQELLALLMPSMTSYTFTTPCNTQVGDVYICIIGKSIRIKRAKHSYQETWLYCVGCFSGWLYPQGVPYITGQFSLHEEITVPSSQKIMNIDVSIPADDLRFLTNE